MIRQVMMIVPGLLISLSAASATFVLVDDGSCRAPIVIAADAPEETTRAANSLAEYIEKISGTRPDIIQGATNPIPAQAVWIGMQPAVRDLFPSVPAAFEHPEEILIVCKGQHLLIAGRDRAVRGVQTEFGTANAVYTFLQKYLDVRWLWPGPLGEDIIKKDTIAFAPFDYRFAPPFLQRELYRRTGGALLEWDRVQRLALDSFWVTAGHGFPRWWSDYHADHPEYFALQPDGTRSGYPGSRDAKLCQSNPGVWRQWLANAAEAFEQDPTLQTFPASPNDGSNAGICVCDRCVAWDHPDGRPWMLSWAGVSQQHVAMSDRYVTFWNHLARGLKQRFPERDLYVAGMAYGPSKPPPIAATLEPNMVIGYVGHFPMASAATRQQEKEQWQGWAKAAPRMIYRPNLFYYSGGWHGLPTLVLDDTMEDFRFLAEHSGAGITVDGMPRYWATQGPQYYLMAQLAWDPRQDGTAVMDNYYRRGFGPAADPIRAYFALMEEAHKGILQTPGWRNSMGVIKQPLTDCILAQYNAERLDEADRLLTEARGKTASGPELYRQRIDFVGTGLEFTRLLLDTLDAMTTVRETNGKDTAAVRRATDLCEQRDRLFARAGGIALNKYSFETTWRDGRGLRDYLGPPSEAFRKAAGLIATYRWTGRGGGNLWATPENWERQDETNWVTAATAPGADDTVILGDHTAADEPQRIALGRDVTVLRVTLDATGHRVYRIVSSDAGANDFLDADSGMLYRLHLADPTPLEQTETASQELRLEVETLLTFEGTVHVSLNSTNGAHIVAERILRTKSALALDASPTPSNGLLELKAKTTAPRVYLNRGAQLLLNASGTVADGALQSADGTVLVRRDAAIGGGIMPFGNTVHFRLYDAGTNDVTIDVGSISRAGTIMLDAPTDSSSGRLILKTSGISATAGRVHAPTLHVAANTFVDLGGDQEPPTRADLSAGIHGAGGLVKSQSDGRHAAPVGIIGDRNTYTGGTFIQSGTLQLAQATIPVAGTVGGAPDVTVAGCLGPGPLHVDAHGTFDLNGLTQHITRLSGEGTIRLNGGRLLVTEPLGKAFSGTLLGPGSRVIDGQEEEIAR